MIESFLRSLPKQNRLTWLLIVLLITLLVSGIWMGWAVSRGIRSNDWTEVRAEVTSRDLALGAKRRRQFRWRSVRVDYTFDGQQLDGFVSVFSNRDSVKQGTSFTVYVNPDRPTELASARGFLAIDYGPPLASSLGMLASIVVVLCIKYSPKDDYESEINQSLL